MFAGLKSSLTSVAMLILKPKPFYINSQSVHVERFLEQCRLGQTRRGSYIMTVTCPLLSLPEDKNNLDEETLFNSTFTRQITRRLYSSVSAIVQSAKDGDMGPLLDDTKPDSAISANLCEAIERIMPKAEGAVLEIGVRWAKKKPVEDLSMLPVALSAKYRPFLNNVTEHLKSQLNINQEEHFYGTIESLVGHWEDEASESRAGTVLFKLKTHDTPEFSATIYLNAKDHKLAHKVYQQKDKIVTVRGIRVRSRNGNRIDAYSDFKVVMT